MGFILDPLYWIVSGVMVVIHKALSPLFGEQAVSLGRYQLSDLLF